MRTGCFHSLPIWMTYPLFVPAKYRSNSFFANPLPPLCFRQIYFGVATVTRATSNAPTIALVVPEA